MILNEWQSFLLIIFVCISTIYPTRSVIVTASKNMILIRTIINSIINSISVIVFILFFTKNYSFQYLTIYMSLMAIICIFEFLIFDANYYKVLKKRILSIPGFINLSKGQIRNELISIYDEVYDIKSIEKVLKRIGYYD